MLRLVKLWESTSEPEPKPKPDSYGNRCLRFIDNALSPTPTFGQPMGQFFRASDIEQWARRRERRAILSGSIIPWDSGCLDWCGKPYPFLSRWRIILVLSGTSFIITMHHYFCNTTVLCSAIAHGEREFRAIAVACIDIKRERDISPYSHVETVGKLLQNCGERWNLNLWRRWGVLAVWFAAIPVQTLDIYWLLVVILSTRQLLQPYLHIISWNKNDWA
jgi:hypothetical protein